MNDFQTKLYALSDSVSMLHYEQKILHTKLGLLFNNKLERMLSLDITASFFISFRGCYSIDLKIRKVKKSIFKDCTRQDFGIVAQKTFEDITNIDEWPYSEICCAFIESIKEQELPLYLFYENGKEYVPYRFHVSVYDFEIRAQLGFFSDCILEIERLSHQKFPESQFIIRESDDSAHSYYLIFSDENEQINFDAKYGIQNLTSFIKKICCEYDNYNVFNNYTLKPIITDKITLKKEGKVMGIMRSNPDISAW